MGENDMSRLNWAESYANELELCVFIGKHWAVLKDGTNQKGLYRKVDISNPENKKNLHQFSLFNDEYYENICDLPSLFYEGEEFENGVLLSAQHPKHMTYFIMGNADKTPKRIEGVNLAVKKEEDSIVFYFKETNEEYAVYDTFSFNQITQDKDGQIGFNL